MRIEFCRFKSEMSAERFAKGKDGIDGGEFAWINHEKDPKTVIVEFADDLGDDGDVPSCIEAEDYRAMHNETKGMWDIVHKDETDTVIMSVPYNEDHDIDVIAALADLCS